MYIYLSYFYVLNGYVVDCYKVIIVLGFRKRYIFCFCKFVIESYFNN